MTEQQLETLRELRSMGHAVCVFTPDEMPNSTIDDVEVGMCKGGWQRINIDDDSAANEDQED